MNLDLKFYWKLFLRRLPAMTALFLVFSLIGVALAIKLPTSYSAEARLIVEAPQISDVSAVTEISDGQTLEIIKQKLLTRANLIDIAQDRQVYQDIRKMSGDEILAAMRNDVYVRYDVPRNSAAIMQIGFSGGDPKTVAAVVNDLVTLVLSENAKIRTGRAVDALAFFEQEVERLEAELSKQNRRIIEFKAQNADALPDSMEYRFSRQDQLQERLERMEREIASLREQKQRITEVYQATGRVQAQTARDLSPDEARLQALQDELQSSLTIYSETHPKIRVLKTQIAGLESQVAAQVGTTSSQSSNNQQDALYDLTVAQIDSRIQSLQNEIAETEGELRRVQDSITRTAPNQITLEGLERDLENTRSQYDAVVQRSNVAAMGERIELSSRGQRISVIENATVPTKPSSPNRPMIMFGGIAGGVAAALGLFLLLELLNRSVRRPAEIVARLGVTPLGAIPYMETASHKWMRRSFRVAAMCLVVFGIPAALWAIDTFYLPLDLVVERVINRVGLG